ncbi:MULTISPECIES: hypothetical protein [Kribbella]|uniref:Uncharacterized protein n=1 Tax=Kribbella karoonensis TaxID=324851 RepID=A0ABP4Q1J9_9ACTN
MTESLTLHPEPLAPGVLLAPRRPTTGELEARTPAAAPASGAVGALYTLLERMGLLGSGPQGR